MAKFMTTLVVVFLGMALAGCGAKQNASDSGTPSASAATSASKYDSGPRAGEQPVDEAQVKTGEQLFKDKGCSACHAFGRRLSCPDLQGVTMRRTAQWMENQILHPEVMVKEDPISHQLMAVYALQMPNQGLTPEQARSVIEFLKHKNHEQSEATAESGAEKKGD